MSNPWDLTDRQQQILLLMADEALTSKEVAHRLGLSFKTVDTHVDRSIHRMGARNRTDALLMLDRERRVRAEAAAREQAERQRAQAREGFVHCPGCGGMGFVREVAA